MSTAPKAGTESQPAPPPSKASTIRLIVLLGVLATVVVMLLVDLLVFKPAAEKARNNLEDKATEKMRAGVVEGESTSDAQFLTQAEVHEAVGRKPLSLKLNPEKDHAIETFAWWGYIPLNRHRFQVLYRKNANGTWIYESHDGTVEFAAKLEDVKPVPGGGLPTRPDPAASEGSGDNKGTDALDNTPPSSVTPPATETPATETPATETPATETPAESTEPPAGREGNP